MIAAVGLHVRKLDLFRMSPLKIIYTTSGAFFGEEKITFGPWGRLNWRGALIRAFTVVLFTLCIAVDYCVIDYVL